MSWWSEFGKALIAPIIGGIFGLAGDKQDRDAQSAANENNAAMQREFAQMGVRWRVADANAAGIHPLFALGAGGAAAAPSYQVGGQSSLGQMGQDVSRAIHSTRTQEERALAVLQLERAGLENQLLETQIHNLQASQFGPPLPSATDVPGPGAYRTGDAVQVQPQRPSASAPGVPQQDAGAIADYGLVRTATGYAIVPSKDAKERIEDQMVPEAMWAYRNLIRPAFKGHVAPDPKKYPLPKGYDHWEWNALAQEFQPQKKGQKFFFNRPVPPSRARKF